MVVTLELTHEPIWERQEGENRKRYDAFMRYLNQPSGLRDYKALVEETGYTKSTLHEYYIKMKWIERASAYDRHRFEMVDKAKMERVLQTAEAVQQQEMLHYKTLLEQFERLMGAYVSSDSQDIKELKRLVDLRAALSKLGRLSVGLPSTYTAAMIKNASKDSRVGGYEIRADGRVETIELPVSKAKQLDDLSYGGGDES